MSTLKAPFPYFGGKSRVAGEVWGGLGDVRRYVEPFAGSLAVLLGRPGEHRGGMEVVNDADGYVVNFWRAVAADPHAVAAWADWPVTELDLTARHLWLVNEGAERLGRLVADPDFYDAQVAGWWAWGLSAWIGGGWCSGRGPWVRDETGSQVIKLPNRGGGVSRRKPSLTNNRGVQQAWTGNARISAAAWESTRGGVSRSLPAISRTQGVSSRSAGRSPTCEPRACRP